MRAIGPATPRDPAPTWTILRSEPGGETGEARHRLLQAGLRGRERDAQVAAAALAESGAVEERHALLLEQFVGQLRRGQRQPAHVGESVEGPGRQVALHSG